MKLEDIVKKYEKNIDRDGETILSNGEYYYALLSSLTNESDNRTKWDRIITIFTKDDFTAWETIYSALTRWKIESNDNLTYMSLSEFNRL